MAVSIISALVAASSLVYAIWRDKIARDERKKREGAEARLLEAHQEREDRLAEPEVIAEMTGHAPEGGGQGRHFVNLIVRNKGHSVAKDVTFGVRWRDREFQAGNGGTAGVIHVLSGGEEVRWAVALDLQVLGELRTGQSRIEAVMHPWARFTDKLGKTYEREWPAPDPDQASASGG